MCPLSVSRLRSKRTGVGIREAVKNAALPPNTFKKVPPSPTRWPCSYRSPTRAVPSARPRSEEHTSELQSLMRNSSAVFCLKKKKNEHIKNIHISIHSQLSKCYFNEAF